VEPDFDESAGTVLPAAMADAAREAAAANPHKRVVVHFMQPHGPFVGSDVPESEVDDRYWEAYDQNLAYVMETARELAADLSGRTVFTADHGQIAPSPLRDAVGVSGHKPGLRHPGLVEVPWGVVDGDRRRVVTEETNEGTADGVDDRLRNLGYKV
jgi:Sulfatase.